MQNKWFYRIVQSLIPFAVVLLFISGCSGTPNSINMSLNQGMCASSSLYSTTAINSMCSTTSSTYNAAYCSLISNNPTTTTPYCMAITVQNNNTGDNANNIQVTSSGLQVTYTPIGTTTPITTTLYDQYSSQVSISGESQQANNVVLFDPKNCVTSTGSYVTTLATGGQSCTFYLEILNESSPVGVNPYALAYNYTNGNANYNVSTTVNQRVYLYGGGNNGLNYVATNVTSAATPGSGTAASWSITGLTGAPTTSVQYIIEGSYGFLYFASGGAVYSDNGSVATQLGSAFANNVTALALDSGGNLYASVTNQGVSVYNPTLGVWVQMQDTNGNITSTTNVTGIKGFEFTGAPNTLYEITSSGTYYCNNPSPTTSTQTCSLASGGTPPSTFFGNAADVDSSGNLYVGGTNTAANSMTVSTYSSNWSSYTANPALNYVANSSYIGSVRWTNQTTTGIPNIYYGVIGLAENNAVYQCSTLTSCAAVVSAGGGNGITGNILSLTTDGLGNLYVGGNTVYSPDWGSAAGSGTGAFLLFGATATSPVVSSWVPIIPNSTTGQPLTINYITAASMLTSY